MAEGIDKTRHDIVLWRGVSGWTDRDVDMIKEGFKQAREELGSLQTADVQEVKHGKWIVDPDEGTAECSACRTVFEDRGDTIPDYWGFCPFCGAKMDMKEGGHDSDSR